MKKKLMILAVSALTILGMNAQNNTDCNNCPAQPCAQNVCPQNCDPQNCNRPDCNRPDCGRPCGEARCLRQFDGLGLTDAQKAQIVELDKARAAERQQLRRELRDKKNHCDSAARVDRRAAQTKYLAELKKVLTPEQYTQFLENAYVNGGRDMKVKSPLRGRHHAKFGDRKFKKDRKYSAEKAAKSNAAKDIKTGKDKKDKKDKK